MATLVLLNGPPASGKSTLAARFVSEHPMALNLDVDVIRGLLRRWIDQPVDAGLAARWRAVELVTRFGRSALIAARQRVRETACAAVKRVVESPMNSL